MKLFHTLLTIASIVALALCVILGGCAAQNHVVPAPIHEFVAPGHTPTSLLHIASALDVFVILSVIAVGIGIGLFFWLPTSHNLSLALIFLGGGVEASALVTRVSLWLVPWLAVSLAVLAVVAFIYEVYTNKTTIETDAESLLSKVKQTATSVEADVKKV
jgi:hypothetical protein